jgi:hypothetical protein
VSFMVLFVAKSLVRRTAEHKSSSVRSCRGVAVRNLDRVAGIIFVVLSIASLRAFPDAGPPEGVPARLNICESFQAITACGDWIWNGHNFDSNYKTNIGAGTIQRTGAEITMSRVNTKAPFGFKGQQASMVGNMDFNIRRPRG